MTSLFRGPDELKIGLSILTRRGGTDANAPENPQHVIPRDWHFGFLNPQILENLGTWTPTNFKTNEDELLRVQDLPK